MQLPQFQAHAELEERHWWFLGRRRILEHLIHAIAPPSKHISILDVGCGTGGMTAFLAREYTCLGVDPSADAIAFARARFPHVRFLRGSAPRDVSSDLSRADLVLLLDVLEHVEKDSEFIEEMVAHLKRGAHLLLFAPADPALWSPHDRGFEHFRRYTAESFRSLWEGLPVTVRLVSHCNARLHPIIKGVRMLARLRGKPWGEAASDLALPPRPINRLLSKILGGEAGVLRDVLLERRKEGFRRGVSVVGVLRRE